MQKKLDALAELTARGDEEEDRRFCAKVQAAMTENPGVPKAEVEARVVAGEAEKYDGLFAPRSKSR